MPEPAGAGRVQSLGEAGGQGDAVALYEAASGDIGDSEPEERHRPDVAADCLLNVGFLRREARPGPMPVQPGVQQLAPALVPANEGGADVAAEDRGAVVAAARVAACEVPAVLAQAPPQGGPACRG